MVKNLNLDDKDILILRILEENCKIPLKEMSKLLNISEAAISKRIRKLERNGIIKRYTIDIDYNKLNLKEVFIGINIKPEKYIDAINEIKNRFSRYYLTNGDHNIIIYFVGTDKDIYKAIEEIKNIDGIEKIYPAFILEKK